MNYYILMAGNLVVSYYSEEINLYLFEEYLKSETMIMFNENKAQEVCNEINTNINNEYEHRVEIVPIGLKLMP